MCVGGFLAVYVGVVVLMGVWKGRLVGPLVVFLSGVGCLVGVEWDLWLWVVYVWVYDLSLVL